MIRRFEVGSETVEYKPEWAHFEIRLMGAWVLDGIGGELLIMAHDLVVEVYFPGEKRTLNESVQSEKYLGHETIHWLGFKCPQYSRAIIEVEGLDG